ncbi:TlpA disulfide reductase family protein [Bailinhaonella thermotolerans]|uniref:TlpA family protein disulfide reductase n=1 Tax=Bailinhaonella thermotolerans TaxID=1070861 RepID=A0A3A4AGL4_9ACTN|nr:TlpA disulfide reductase family protein [Bailinhaonella thermotolerans]RJL25060.1 TlpA family protein disulfide reductase [Bailinhaonella thermotolerans]
MTAFTLLIDGREERLDLTPGGRAPATTLLGWTRKPHGWCKGDACIPAFRAAEAEDEDGVDVVRFAALLGRTAVADLDEKVIAFGEGGEGGEGGLAEGVAPDFTLDGTALADLRGKKVALVFWASWCGCRYDLAAWDERHRELAPHGFSVVSVALDRNPEDARPWRKDLAHPALTDADGLVAELYNVINVPTVVWIDEEGRIVRPQDTMTATDTFRSMNGLDSARSMEALRRWVVDGDPGLTPEAVREHLRLPTPEERRARVHARLAAWFFGRDRRAAAVRHRDAAASLAPHDVTIRRGLMPLAGIDPFGDEYFTLRAELESAGIPLYRPLPE